MRYQVVETKVFVVEAEDETAAQMATDALQNEMQMAERSFVAYPKTGMGISRNL